MYEGRFQAAGLAQGPDRAGEAEHPRVLSWAELAARFDAARDFRRWTRGHPGSEAGSFDAAFARHISGHGEGKPDINPFALADGKSTDCTTPAGTGEATTGDRGRQ